MNGSDLVIYAPWIWLAAALGLAIGEIAVPGVFLMWLGIAAGITGLVSLLGLPLPLQFGLFAIAAVASVAIGRRWFSTLQIVSDDPLLNERTARLIGRSVVVVSPIQHGEGRVRVGDSEWIAAGDDAAVGSNVRIVGARGGRLLVEPSEG